MLAKAAKIFESQLAGSLLEVDGQLAFKKLARATLETLMPRIEGKGEFGQARWRLVYAPHIPSLRSLNPSEDPLKSLASYISFNTEVEVQLGKRLQVVPDFVCYLQLSLQNFCVTGLLSEFFILLVEPCSNPALSLFSVDIIILATPNVLKI